MLSISDGRVRKITRTASLCMLLGFTGNTQLIVSALRVYDAALGPYENQCTEQFIIPALR